MGDRHDAPFAGVVRAFGTAFAEGRTRRRTMGTYSRRKLETMLAKVVAALREQSPEGNLTFRVPETGDLVAVLQLDDEEASDLARLLGPPS